VVPNQPDIRYSEQSINNILMLKGFVQYIPSLFEALTGANSDLLVMIRENCHPSKIAATVEYIRGVINEDVTYQKAPLDLRNQRTYAVKVIASFLSFDTRILIIV
jgi:DNA mismatch repair protein MSH4